MPLDQFNGYHLIPAMLVGVTPFFTRDDYEHYLSRLHALPGALQNMSDATRAGMEDALNAAEVSPGGGGSSGRCVGSPRKGQPLCTTRGKVPR